MIDSHQHFWRYDAAQYAWIDDSMGALRRDFLPPEARRVMMAAGVDGTIAVQAQQSEQETDWLLDLADADPFIRGVVGWVDLAADDAERELERFAAEPRIVGIRHVVQAEPAGFMDRADFRRGVAAVGRHDLVYDILIYERQMAEAARFAAALPNQRFVLDHFGKPDVRGGSIAEWRRGLQALAALPQVWCKLSGLVTEADWQAWTPAQLRPYFDTALEAFGPARLMFGSDWPVCEVAATYEQVVEAMTAILGGRPAEIFGGTAVRAYGLEIA